MTTRFLLDTNTLSQLVRDPRGPVATHINTVDESQVFTSIIVACELCFGARKRGSAALSARVDQLLGSIEVAALEGDVDRHYADVRETLERRGQQIGANDLLIAAHTLAADATLVTDNIAEFERVPGLRLEDWIRAL